MFKSILAIGLLSFAAIPALAQNSDYPRFEFGGGYSYLRANIKATDKTFTPPESFSTSFDMHGGKGEIVGNINKTLGLVGEFGGYKVTGLPSGLSAHVLTYLFGPRLNYRGGSEKITPFVQALFGGARASGSGNITILAPDALQRPQGTQQLATGFEFSGDTNSFAMAIGGGVDYNATKHISIRFLQVDYLMTRFDTNINAAGNSTAGTQHNFRIGAGLQFKF